jgi:hypothetical protein
MIPTMLLLTGCKAPPEAPTELSDLAGFLFEHFQDEDERGLEDGIVNLRAWLDVNIDQTLEGYEVANIDESVLDSVNPDREHDLENLGGASVAYETTHTTAAYGRTLLLEEQEEVFPKAYKTHDRKYLTDKTCFMSHECDFVDTDNRVSASYVIINVDTHSQAQYRWIEYEKDQYAFLHRAWLIDEADAGVDWVDINEQIYMGVTMPRDGGAVRLGTTWISAVVLDGVFSDTTILNTMIDAMQGEGESLDEFLEGE